MDDLKEVLAKGKQILSHQARVGKLRLELMELKQDRRKVFERLGREAYNQLLDGAIPKLVEFERPFEVLQDLDERIRALEEELGAV